MRLFIASKAVLYDYGGIREDFAGVIEGKWVEEENLHLTWVFLGEHEDAQGFLQKLTQMPPLTHCVAIRGIGSFGHPPRLLYGRVEDSVLQERAAEFERAGFGMARFRPHVSLCRIKNVVADDRLRALLHLYREKEIGFIEKKIVLYGSILSHRGPTYYPIE